MNDEELNVAVGCSEETASAQPPPIGSNHKLQVGGLAQLALAL